MTDNLALVVGRTSLRKYAHKLTLHLHIIHFYAYNIVE